MERVLATRGGQGEPPANMTVKGDFDIALQ